MTEQNAVIKAETTDVVQVPQSTLALAIEKGMDPVTISKLMDLQERWEAGQSRKAFVEAMAGFKRECPAVIGKDKRADFGAGKAKYSYATTGAIVTAITPALSKYGLSLSWETKQEARLVTVTCHITHSGGHRESASLTGPHDESGGKNPIQTLGSSVHYLQRYTMVSVLGLATADMNDPDNNNSTRDPITEPKAKAPQQEQSASSPATGNSITLTVGKVSIQTQKKDGTPLKGRRYFFKADEDERFYSTFSETIGTQMQELQGADAVIEYVEDKFGRTVQGIKPVMSSSTEVKEGDVY